MFADSPKVKELDWTKEKTNEALRILEVFLVHGVEPEEAKNRVIELYSPPRVTNEIHGKCGRFLQTGSTFDLRPGRDGKSWDLSKPEVRAKVRRQISREKPYLVIGSPPCTDFSLLQINWNFHRMQPEEVKRRMIEARLHLSFCAEIYEQQLKSGRHFLHEHPATAASWVEEPMKKLMSHPSVDSVVGHMCQYQMTIADSENVVRPVLKPTRWMSTAPAILARLGRRCRGDHKHTQLLGKMRTQSAAEYPVELCREILL